MGIYKKQTFTGGKWAIKSELYEKKVTKAKIVSETNAEPSWFKSDKGEVQEQDVCKVQFEGDSEALKVSLNRATINGLVEAFGEDSARWQGHTLALEIDKLPGKKYPLYLIPEGFERVEDDNGYSVIVREGQKPEKQEDLPSFDNPEKDVNAVLDAEVPF